VRCREGPYHFHWILSCLPDRFSCGTLLEPPSFISPLRPQLEERVSSRRRASGPSVPGRRLENQGSTSSPPGAGTCNFQWSAIRIPPAEYHDFFVLRRVESYVLQTLLKPLLVPQHDVKALRELSRLSHSNTGKEPPCFEKGNCFRAPLPAAPLPRPRNTSRAPGVGRHPY